MIYHFDGDVFIEIFTFERALYLLVFRCVNNQLGFNLPFVG